MTAQPHLVPGTRIIRRRPSHSGWWLGMVVAVGANFTIVWVLARISHREHHFTMPPTAVRQIQHEEDRELPPPPPHEQVPDEPPPVAQLQLPDLDLAPAAADASFTLPPMLSDDLVMLPLSIPPIRIDGPVASAPTTVAGDSMELQADEPARVSPGIESVLEHFYPRQARLRNVTGESRLRLAISATGAVTQVTVLASTPPGVFDQAVQRAAMALTFSPAKRAGQPFATVQIITIQWNLRK